MRIFLKTFVASLLIALAIGFLYLMAVDGTLDPFVTFGDLLENPFTWLYFVYCLIFIFPVTWIVYTLYFKYWDRKKMLPIIIPIVILLGVLIVLFYTRYTFNQEGSKT